MIKLFHGDDTFESYTNAVKTAKSSAKELSFEVKVINGDDIQNIEEISSLVEGIDMFSTGSVFFIKRLLKNKKVLDYFVEKFEALNSFEIILWQDGKADGKLKLVKLLQSKKSTFLFNSLKAWELNSWVQKVAKNKELTLSDNQINKIVESSQENKWLLVNELKKIDIYLRSSNKKSISDNELSILNGSDARGDIWKFLDHFSSKNIHNTISEFLKIYKFESNVNYFISMINRELNLLAKVIYIKENNLDYKLLKLHPFVLQKVIKKIHNFKLEEIKKKMQSLVDLDYNIKTGILNDKTGMILYLSQIN